MTKTHWKKLYNPDYLGAYSLDNGQGGYTDLVSTIKVVRVEKVVGTDGKKEDCPVMHLEGNKPMVLNATNQKTLEKILKTPYIEDWAGRTIQIGVEPVKAFGDVVDALRIRPFLPKVNGPAECVSCHKEITAAENLSAVQVEAYSTKKYGKPLCAECMTAIKKAKDEAGSNESEAASDESDS